MWGLLFNLITKEASQDIGESIGKVLEVDCKAIVADRARFLCIQVELPLKKPIKRGALVLSPKGDKVWIAFQYERLVGLCFNYGLIGHEARDCHHPISSTEEDKPYGEWLGLEVEWQRVQEGRNKQVHHNVIQKGPRTKLGISHNHHESNRWVKLTAM